MIYEHHNRYIDNVINQLTFQDLRNFFSPADDQWGLSIRILGFKEDMNIDHNNILELTDN